MTPDDAIPATESDAQPESGPVSDRDAQDAREAIYAEAIMGGKDRAALLAVRNPGEVANAHRDARAIMAVADAELAPLVARVAELEAERDELRELLNNEDADFWQRRSDKWMGRALKAEAALARVAALADEASRRSQAPDDFDPNWRYQPATVRESDLRAALAAAGPAVSDGESATSEACEYPECDRVAGHPGFHTRTVPRPATPVVAPSATDEEPCVCGTGFTCMARTHRQDGE